MQYNRDAHGRMTSAQLLKGQNVSYGYDALGRRASRTANGSTTKFLYDGADVVLDKASDGSSVDYLNGGGIDNKLRQTSSSAPTSPQYFLQDHLGNTIALTDASGGVSERQQYEPFGASSGSTLTRYGYTGREMDEATGLMYYRARWYDPQQSRFISEDPIGGMNRYAYANNNPTIYGDPLGMDGWLMPTLRGAAGAFNEDNGMPAPPGEQNSLGRGIGHGIAIVQGLQEIVGGIGLGLGGGAEAVATSPAAVTVIGTAVPAVGVAVAAVGGVMVIHGSYVLINTGYNIFASTNPSSSGGQSGGSSSGQSGSSSQPCYDVNGLSQAASAPDKGGFTAAGRSLTKHGAGARIGNSKFPAAKGSPSQINQMAQEIVDEILTDPGSVFKNSYRGRFGDTLEITAPNGRGLVFDANGKFLFFKE